MKKILFIIAFLFAGVVFANAQTPTTKDNATTPTKKAQVGDLPAAPAVPAIVSPETANIEANSDTAATNAKACSKQKESCNKGDKSCCKNKKTATADDAKEKSCCKKDKGACHSKKADATETTTPPNPIESTPAVVPGSPATPANK
jgi:hypothetical protein